jgi:hypothetical protein
LFFNLIIAACYSRIHPWLQKAGDLIARQAPHPARIGLCWYLLTMLLFLPLVLIFGDSAWTGIGPFHFQLSRLLLYFGYFVLGMLLGIAGTGQGLLAKASRFNTAWPRWVIGCLLAYTALKLVGPPIQALEDHGRINETQARLLYRSVWSLSCTATCIAFLTLFHHLFNRGRAASREPAATVRHAHPAWSSLATNAYGIYLIHYLFVTWLQFFLLPAALPAAVKFSLTFIGALTLSWGLTGLLRRIPLVKKYL